MHYVVIALIDGVWHKSCAEKAAISMGRCSLDDEIQCLARRSLSGKNRS